MSDDLRIDESGSALQFAARGRRSFGTSTFLAAWVIAWVISQTLGPSRFLAGETSPWKIAIVWYLIWTPGGLVALYALLWSLVGWEQGRVEPASLSLKRAIFGWGRVRVYDAARIRDLRLYSKTVDVTFKKPPILGGGRLAFNYGAAVVRFVDTVTDADAQALLERIRSRLNPS